MNLFVTGLMNDMDDVDLKEMFELYGEVKTARVVMDRQTGKSRCFGFVEMTNDNEANEVIALLNGVQMGRFKMSVQEAEQQQPSSRPPQRNNNRPPYGGGGNRRY
jgi:RNA recognition motif-containing protein